MDEIVPERRRGVLDLAFWPTNREPGFQQPLIANFNCQRCGLEVLPVQGWWCRRCVLVARRLQIERGMSMVAIAAMGEYEPTHGEWIQDIAPWLIPERVLAVPENMQQPAYQDTEAYTKATRLRRRQRRLKDAA